MSQSTSRIFYHAGKRLLDLAAAGSALVVFSPVMLVVAILVRRRMGGPVIFRHPRPGLHGVTFKCLKFRTMTNEIDANGELLHAEKRLTLLGKTLRRFSLDELPQLWNVVRGDMSLVGPRPLEVWYLSRYSEEQNRRHSVMPGITGWSQINGRNAIEWDQRLSLDVWYVDHCSLWLDIKILFLTLSRVWSGDGVSHADCLTGTEFEGTGRVLRPEVPNLAPNTVSESESAQIS